MHANALAKCSKILIVVFTSGLVGVDVYCFKKSVE